MRAFNSDRIDRELFVKILEPSLRAPSWADTQPREIVIAAGEPIESLEEVL
jgi:nitroreductase